MSNKIPTARQTATSKAEAERMIAFAKLHVKAALEAAAENAIAEMTVELNDDEYPIVNKDSILNAYPENLIK